MLSNYIRNTMYVCMYTGITWLSMRKWACNCIYKIHLSTYVAILLLLVPRRCMVSYICYNTYIYIHTYLMQLRTY